MLTFEVTTSRRHGPARTESFVTSVTCMMGGGTAGAGEGRSLAENLVPVFPLHSVQFHYYWRSLREL